MKSKKKMTIIICSILIVLLIAICPVLFIMDKPAQEIMFTGSVTVENGVANPAGENLQVVVEEDGEYYWIYDWMGEPGMLTGMRIKAPDGEVVFACTAEGCYAESLPMELKAGTYEMEIVYLTNDEDMQAFLSDNGITEIGSEPYTYINNGAWSTEYTVGLEENSVLSIGVKVAVVVGLAIGLLVVVICLAVTKNGDEMKNQFDERQELVRGRGFMYGFFTLISSNAVLVLLNVLEVSLFRNMEVALTASILVGVAVFASYCIWNDGYFALNENRKSMLITFGLIGVLNLVIGIGNLASGEIIENGAFTFRCLNLFCALLFLVIFGVLLLKQIKDGKEE